MPSGRATGRIFISYPNSEQQAVVGLRDRLRARGLDVIMDINLDMSAQEWRSALADAIEHSDKMLFLITPDSISAASNCPWEFEVAQAADKGIVTALFAPLDPKAIPDPISKIHFINLTEAEHYDARVDQVFDALCKDIEWEHKRTDLTRRAEEWAAGGERAFDLPGRNTVIRSAEEWRDNRPPGVAPPGSLVLRYIGQARRRYGRIQRIAVGVVVAFAFAAGGVAYNSVRAQRAAETAQAVAEDALRGAAINAAIAQENAAHLRENVLDVSVVKVLAEAARAETEATNLALEDTLRQREDLLYRLGLANVEATTGQANALAALAATELAQNRTNEAILLALASDDFLFSKAGAETEGRYDTPAMQILSAALGRHAEAYRHTVAARALTTAADTGRILVLDAEGQLLEMGAGPGGWRVEALSLDAQGLQGATDATVSADGQTLASVHGGTLIRLWSRTDGQGFEALPTVIDLRALRARLLPDAPAADDLPLVARQLTLSGDGQRLSFLMAIDQLAGGSEGITLEVQTGTILHETLTDSALSPAVYALSDDGDRLVAGNSDGRITLWPLTETGVGAAELETDLNGELNWMRVHHASADLRHFAWDQTIGGRRRGEEILFVADILAFGGPDAGDTAPETALTAEGRGPAADPKADALPPRQPDSGAETGDRATTDTKSDPQAPGGGDGGKTDEAGLAAAVSQVGQQSVAPDLGAVHTAVMSPDGRFVAARFDEGWVISELGAEGSRRLFDIPVRSFPGDDRVDIGRQLVFVDPYHVALVFEGHISVWRFRSEDMLARQAHDAAVASLAFHPDGRTLFSGGEGGAILRWDMELDAPTPTGIALDLERTAMALRTTQSGVVLASAQGDGTIALVDATTGVAREEWDAPATGLTDLALSPDGQMIAALYQSGQLLAFAAGQTDPMIDLADVGVYGAATLAISDSGSEIVIGAPGAAPSEMAASDDGTMMARVVGDADAAGGLPMATGTTRLETVSVGGAPHVLHLQSQLTIQRLGDDGDVTAMALSPDGRHAAIGYGDGSVAVYPIAPDAAGSSIFQLACARLATRDVPDLARTFGITIEDDICDAYAMTPE